AFEDGGTAALDFTDAGMATTYRMPLERIEQGFDTLVATARSGRPGKGRPDHPHSFARYGARPVECSCADRPS
ncbi:MAG: hypothetical protein AAFX00_07960, partial [Pseudomonadota bacterium]